MRKITVRRDLTYSLGILLAVYLLIFYNNPNLRSSFIPYLVSYGATGTLLILSILKRKISYIRVLLWMVVFCGFCFLSITWSVDEKTTSSRLLELFVKLIAVYGIAGIIKEETDFITIVKLFIFVLVTNVIIAVSTGVLSEIIYLRQNISYQNSTGWNSNGLGLMAVYAIVLISMFFLKNCKIETKLLIIGLVAFLLYVALATGSRKAFLFPLIYFAITYIFSTKNGRIRKIIIGIVIIILAYEIIINTPVLYSMIGFRLEAALDLVQSGSSTDMSAITRQDMIEYASELVQKRPLLGYGFYGFSYMYGKRTGLYTYAHNNYLEIMVGVGIIGLLTYYSLYLVIFKSLTNKMNNTFLFKKHQIVALLIAQMVIDFALVSCFDFNSVMLLVLCYVATQIPNKKNEVI